MEKARQIQLGCGGNRLPPPWENYDIEMDISKPLPFSDNCAEMIYCSHVVEHIKHVEAFSFFEECYRVLETNGTLKVTVPSFPQILERFTPEYGEFMYAKGWARDASRKEALRSNLACHGHQGAWNTGLLVAFLRAVGFEANEAALDANIDLHWRATNKHVDDIESISVIGRKVPITSTILPAGL